MIADGPPARVLNRARLGAFELLVPDLVREELLRVLATKLAWDRDRLERLDDEIDTLASATPIAPQIAAEVTGDPADDRILACAVAAGADVLVSGDRRHLLPIGGYEGVRILRPQDLLAELSRRG